jgi:hypothetical protein
MLPSTFSEMPIAQPTVALGALELVVSEATVGVEPLLEYTFALFVITTSSAEVGSDVAGVVNVEFKNQLPGEAQLVFPLVFL